MTLKGDLRRFSFIRVLDLITASRRTGTLSIDSPDGHATLAFENGNLTYAEVDGSDYPLMEMLQRGGRLSEEECQDVERRAATTSDGERAWLLVRSEQVTRSEIIGVVQAHVLRNVFRVFEWLDGAFVFESRRDVFEDRILVSIDLSHVIVAGSRQVRQAAGLDEALPEVDAPLRLAPGAAHRLTTVRLSLDEWRIVSLAGEQKTVEQIAGEAHLEVDEVRRIAYGLQQARLIEVVAPAISVRSADG